MPKLSISLTNEHLQNLEARAKLHNLSFEEYVLQLLTEEARAKKDWPEGYFETVIGGWRGPPLKRE